MDPRSFGFILFDYLGIASPVPGGPTALADQADGLI